MNNLFSLENKTVIVTGACGLLGRQHCKALAAAGANVVAIDLNADAVEALAEQLGEQHTGLKVSVVNKNELETACNFILNVYGSIDVLVNNAAINDMFENPAMAAEQSKFENYPLDMWESSLKVNVTGTFLPAQVFGKVMAAQGKGSIINIASTYGVVGPDQSIYRNGEDQTFFKSPSYPTTKGAILNFTRFLAAYWGSKGVRVNTLSPGGVQNGQDDWFVKNYSYKTALGRMAQPDDYHGAVVFLASDASRYMTGANLIVDGGWTAV